MSGFSLPRSLAAVSEKTSGKFSQAVGSDHKDPTYIADVNGKLAKHPDFRNKSRKEIKNWAQKLTSMESVKEYFSEYLEHTRDTILRVTAKTRGKGITDPSDDDFVDLGASDSHAANGASVTESRPHGASIASTGLESMSVNLDPIHKVASFPLKLFLTPLPPDNMIVGENEVASLLETKYGPMHAALQVGNVMIEWTPYDLVVPHYNIPSDPVVKTDVTKLTQVASELREKAKEHRRKHQGAITGEVDLMFEISKSVELIVTSIVKVIVTWNRFYTFHTYNKNSQHFVENVLRMLGIEEVPIVNKDLSAYVDQLKGDFRREVETSFQNHAELDNYVRERISTLKTSDMEYLLTQYYRFHVASRTTAIGSKEEWRCMEEDCQMRRLERKINAKELLITSLGH